MFDFLMAVLHHVIIFALFGVLLAELIMVRRGMDAGAIARVSALDLWYGILAGLIVVVGFARAIFAAKGWDYYEHNAFFWVKIATFVVIGLLSVPPTLQYPKWRRAGTAPADEAVARVRRFLWIEVILFVPLLAIAAAMTRGYGWFG